jgi:hypothetical protein
MSDGTGWGFKYLIDMKVTHAQAGHACAQVQLEVLELQTLASAACLHAWPRSDVVCNHELCSKQG